VPRRGTRHRVVLEPVRVHADDLRTRGRLAGTGRERGATGRRAPVSLVFPRYEATFTQTA
jgi:hypothetical protein